MPWAPSTQHPRRSWALRPLRNILFSFPISAGVETLCKGETEQLTRNTEEKALTGAGFLLRWTSQYIFCRCLGAACKRQPAQDQRGNQGCSLVFQLHLTVLSSPAVMTSQPALPRIRSPWTDHAGQIWGRTELAEKLGLLLPKSRISLETPTHNGGCARKHTHR